MNKKMLLKMKGNVTKPYLIKTKLRRNQKVYWVLPKENGSNLHVIKKKLRKNQKMILKRNKC